MIGNHLTKAFQYLHMTFDQTPDSMMVSHSQNFRQPQVTDARFMVHAGIKVGKGERSRAHDDLIGHR